MMEREWRSLLAMYGQEVTLRLEGMEDRPLRAFLQPVLDREWKDRAFEVQSAHLVGDSHWWALLRPRDREAT